MLRIATVLLVVAVGLLATRVLSGTVAEVLPCEDNITCLSDRTVAYEVTVPGWTTPTTVSFGSQAGTRLLVPRTGNILPTSSPSSNRTGWRAGELLPCRNSSRHYFLHAVAGTVQPPDSLGAGGHPALAAPGGDPDKRPGR